MQDSKKTEDKKAEDKKTEDKRIYEAPTFETHSPLASVSAITYYYYRGPL